MSRLMRSWVAGLIANAAATTYFVAPFVNSYKRFVAGTFAPTKMVWSRDNRTSGFRVVGELNPGTETVATIPDAETSSGELAEVMVRNLTAAGLYEAEARAMVGTWEKAWFRDEGLRVLYLVPRARTDELLPLKVDPKPTEVVRVLVGRHDFLTPELEAAADRLVERNRAARAEVDASELEIRKLGRFADHQTELLAGHVRFRSFLHAEGHDA